MGKSKKESGGSSVYLGDIDINKATKPELVQAIKSIYNSSRGKAYTAYKYQIESINDYLADKAIVDYDLDDKDSKKFDRGKVLLDKLEDYVAKEEKLLESLVKRNVDVDRILDEQEKDLELKRYDKLKSAKENSVSRSPHTL